MNKKKLGIILFIGVLIIGVYYFTREEEPKEIVPENNIVQENIVDEESKEKDEEKHVSAEEKQKVEIAAGKEVPNFTLKNLDDEEVSLEDYRGKIVLLNFWATWCVYCDIEMPDLQKLDKENEDVVVLAVDVMEEKQAVVDYIKKGGYDFQVLLDEDGALARSFLVGGFPASYFIDQDGVLIGSVPGMMTYEQMNKVINDIRGDK